MNPCQVLRKGKGVDCEQVICETNSSRRHRKRCSRPLLSISLSPDRLTTEMTQLCKQRISFLCFMPYSEYLRVRISSSTPSRHSSRDHFLLHGKSLSPYLYSLMRRIT